MQQLKKQQEQLCSENNRLSRLYLESPVGPLQTEVTRLNEHRLIEREILTWLYVVP